MIASKTIELRPAERGDIALLAPFAARMFTAKFGHIYHPKDLQLHLDMSCSEHYFESIFAECHIMLAWDDAQAIRGFAKWGDCALPVEAAQSPVMEIHRLYVDPSLQGQGIGHRLMQHMLASPQAVSSVAIYLGVFSENTAAQRFYRRYGFEKCGAYDYHVGGHIDHDYIFRRQNLEQSR